jgi:hypothetical protein
VSPSGVGRPGTQCLPAGGRTHLSPEQGLDRNATNTAVLSVFFQSLHSEQ